MKTHKNAQMEVMGLVVIVMIVTVALLFVLFFMTKDKGDNTAKSFDSDLHSYNTISAILQANTPCRDLKISDILQECASFDQPMPIDCVPLGNEGHCEYAQDQIFLALNKSLDYINEEYKFYVYTESEPNNYKVDIGSDNAEAACAKSKSSATQPVRYSGGNLFVALDICG